MKKFILTFALLLSGITLCFADFVGKDQVNEIAKKWFSSENFTVTLDSEGKQQLIYKHAISTIVPARPIDLTEEEEAAL